VWQALYEDVKHTGFVVLSVALDSGGRRTTEPWITAAKPTYPCLIDERHIVADLYGMVNVPNAVWIDEGGRIVRPSETAGSTDAFRTELDRTSKQMTATGLAERERARTAYFDAVRDWARNGSASRFVPPRDEARRRLPSRGDDHARAAAHFRLGQHLHAAGHREAALPHLAEARRLHPASWSYRRQTWELEEPGKAGSPTFWAAVDALGDQAYYPIALDMGGARRTPQAPHAPGPE